MKKHLLLILFFALTFQNKAQTVSDVEGNTYNTITIGTQVWMKENLRTTKYNDGTVIPNVTGATAWIALSTAAYCWYNNDATTYKVSYGGYYNWYVVGTGKLCPTGWHVPANVEWTTLITYLGGANIAGGKLKEEGTIHWASPNQGADNSSGFTGLPGGFRDSNNNGSFDGFTGGGLWWSSTENSSTKAWDINLSKFITSANIGENGDKRSGESVRCLKDSNSIEQVTIIFNVDGGSAISSLVITKNTKITQPTDPTKTGYTFSGWYKEVSYINAWDFATDVATTNITLFAKWTATTFVEYKQLADFKIYPNPAKDKLYINFNSPNFSGAIFDLQGKRVVEIKTGINPVDISNLSKGIYFVKIINSGNIIVDKLIKE